MQEESAAVAMCVKILNQPYMCRLSGVESSAEWAYHGLYLKDNKLAEMKLLCPVPMST